MATILSLSFAVVGYCAFGEETLGNILNNFPESDLPINIARIFLALTMFFTFPFAFVVVRFSTNKLFFLESEFRTPKNIEHFLVTSILFGIVLSVSMFVTDLGVVYEIFGGLCAVSIAYIGPASVYLSTLENRFSMKGVFAINLFIFGIISMLASVGVVVYQLIIGEK